MSDFQSFLKKLETDMCQAIALPEEYLTLAKASTAAEVHVMEVFGFKVWTVTGRQTPQERMAEFDRMTAAGWKLNFLTFEYHLPA